jgi:hypothetical protein
MKPMKRHAILATMSLLIVAAILTPLSVFGQASPAVTGAGEAALPVSTSFSGVSINSEIFGTGVFILGDGTAVGEFQATLLGTNALGQTQTIIVESEAASGSIGTGNGTFSGAATVNMGDATPPLINVPITVTATPTSLLLILSNVNLPATLTAGNITIY